MILGDTQQEFSSPQEAFAHFGTKGMKWGVRKERAANLHSLIEGDITRTTANGDQFTLSSKPPNRLHKALAAASENYSTEYQRQAYVSIKDKSDKTIGEANFWYVNDKPDTVYLNWITVRKHARGNGYASSILKAAEEHSRAAGKKKMVLEVPGNAPDARHIYEKMGFKVTKEAKDSAKSDPVWGGLTHMEKSLVDED